MPVRIATGNEYVGQSLIAEAIRYAVAQGARVIYVGTGSLGPTDELRAAVEHASEQGAVIVAPAGSDALNQTLDPAAFPSVISVITLTPNGAVMPLMCLGGRETVGEVGGEVNSLDLEGNMLARYGSSMAAARVAGFVGKLLLKEPRLAPAQVRELIRTGTDPIQPPGWELFFEIGRLNREKALARTSPDYLDVAVRSLAIMPPNPLPGQAPVAKVRVQNRGARATGPLLLRLSVQGRETSVRTLESLPLASFQELELPLSASLSSTSNIEVSIDPLVGENDTTNNSRQVTVAFATAPVHNIRIWIEPLASTAYESTVLKVPVRIQNLGNQPDRPTVVLYVDAQQIHEQTLNMLPGADGRFEIEWRLNQATGQIQTLRAVASLPVDDDRRDNEWMATFRPHSRNPLARLQYADTAPPFDVVLDAPWRTIRSYVPILIFLPEVPGHNRIQIKQVEIAAVPFNADLRTLRSPPQPPAFRDRNESSSLDDLILPGTQILDPDGMPRKDLSNEVVSSFWHYIVKLPASAINALGNGASFDRPETDFYVEARFRERFFNALAIGEMELIRARVLRVQTGLEPFPKFADIDHYYDAHVHTIAEQTQWGLDEDVVDTPKKAFGGPLAMLMESSYALGLVDRPLTNANWTDFKDQLVTTDHNVFFSDEMHKSMLPAQPLYTIHPSSPQYGPTRFTRGGVDEFAWYRKNLGRLAGEEVTLAGGFLGRHFLAYGAEHFEGPWHGGKLGLSQTENTITMLEALRKMRNPSPKSAGLADPELTFGFAAHPVLFINRWPDDYFAQALGLPPWNTESVLNPSKTEFLFKGSQIWNQRVSRRVTFDFGRGITTIDSSPPSEIIINPFPVEGGAGRFTAIEDSLNELYEGLSVYYKQLSTCMRYAFEPKKIFIRKVYTVAGSDAHGDFNYADDLLSTKLNQVPGVKDGFGIPKLKWMRPQLEDTAYGRVRTLVLTHDRFPNPPLGTDMKLLRITAYENGNSIMTDGPICVFNYDSDGRHNPDANPRWHDDPKKWMWENAEGRIGGSGKLDGGRTVLIPFRAGSASDQQLFMETRWMRSATLNALNVREFTNVIVRADGVTNRFSFEAGPEKAPFTRKAPSVISLISASMLEAHAPHSDVSKRERAITNPIWMVPVPIDIVLLQGEECPISPGKLIVTFHFPISMSGCGDVLLEPLDGAGNSFGPPIRLVPYPDWLEENGVFRGKFVATNPDEIPCLGGSWDANIHAPRPPDEEVYSYVVYMTRPAELHGNVLNDIGRTFVVGRSKPRITRIPDLPYRTIPPEYFVLIPSFNARTYLVESLSVTSLERAEVQLSGRLGPNLLDTTSFGTNGYLRSQGTINYEGPGAAKGWFEDAQSMPGLGELKDTVKGIALEIQTYLFLPRAGVYQMGVNCPDAFRVSISNGPYDPFALTLAEFDAERPLQETLFSFEVRNPGYYPFRLVSLNGENSPSLEWYMIDSEGRRVLINDPESSETIRAYSDLQYAPVSVTALIPSSGARNVPESTSIQVAFQTGEVTIDPGSIRLRLDGETVAPTVSLEESLVSIWFSPPTRFTPGSFHRVVLDYLTAGAVSSPAFIEWNFQVRPEPTISHQLKGATVILTFDGTLQSSESVTGPFVTIPQAANPFSVSTEGTQRFFRAVYADN